MQQQQQQENEQNDSQLMSIIQNSVKSIDANRLKELRRLLRMENLFQIEQISTLEYVKYNIQDYSMRNGLHQLENEYKMMFRTLGDGNCFYRQVMICYIFWLAEQQDNKFLEEFIQRIYKITSLTSIFQTLTIDCKHLKTVFLLFLLKILDDKRKGQAIKMLDIVRLYNSLPEVDFAAVIICRQLVYNTYVEFQNHESIRDFLDDEMKERIEFVMLRYFYEAQYLIIPLAAQTFQCELIIQNFYKPDEYSNKVNLEKINYQPHVIEDKNQQLKQLYVLYTGGHYEILISDSQAKKDFYNLNNKKYIQFNNQLNEYQQKMLLNHFIARYQAEIVRMNSIEEANFYKQQQGDSNIEYQSLEWQRLQRNDEYIRIVKENQLLKKSLENLQQSVSDQNNQQNIINFNKENQGQNDQFKNSKNGSHNSNQEVEGADKSLKKQSSLHDYYRNINNQLDQPGQQLHSKQQQSEKQMTNNHYESQDSKLEKKEIDNKACVSCMKQLPQDFKSPYWLLPLEEEEQIDCFLHLCKNCFESFAEKYQAGQEYIEIKGKLYELTTKIISELKKREQNSNTTQIQQN